MTGGWTPLAQAADAEGLGRPGLPKPRVSKVREITEPGAVKARDKVAQDSKANAEQAARAKNEQQASWPGPGSVTVALTGSEASGAPGGLPITLSPQRETSLPRDASAQLSITGREDALAAGVNGVLFSVKTNATGRVQLSVDYEKLAGVIGGGWSQRLRLVQLPACALTTPGEAACSKQTPLRSHNAVAEQLVTASAVLPDKKASNRQKAADATGTAVFALSAADVGEGQNANGSGDYSATALSESSTWEAGGSSGSFNWSYDFTAPPAAAGPAPELSLAYSSSSVDGYTAATNNQGTSVGEGFSFTDSYIERMYVGCDEDGHEGIYDQCWKYENAKIVLNGKASLLVKDKTSGQWRLQDDDGSSVVRATGAENGDDNGEYWTVTTGEGTKYVFGLNKLDGAGDQRTNSTWTVPVFGDDSGEPGYSKGNTFADRSAKQAWRWNLDYVEDASGTAATYWYAKEGNYYKKNKSESANAAYDRGGYLKEIKYGQRKDSLFTREADAKITFGYAERCTVSDCNELTKDTAENWPDVPFDAICTSGDKECLAVGPSYFSRKRLTKINTYSWSAASSTYDAVDSWEFIQRYLDGGDIGDTSDHVLTLQSIKRTGKTGTAIAMDPVLFTYQMRPNRVDATDDILPLTRPRLSTITSETGAITTVTMSSPECVRSEVTGAAEDSNTRNCFPQYWHINGAEDASVDWFHKYRVLAVSIFDPAGQNDAVEHEYVYSGAAWNYSDDPLITKSERTWSDWRGYRQVTSYTGAKETTRSKTISLYMQGMDGDHRKDGSARSVSIAPLSSPSLGLATLKDSDQYAGHLREQVTYDGTTAVKATSSEPWSSETARQGTPDAADHVARFLRTYKETTHTYLTVQKVWRSRTIENKYDSHGMIYESDDRGDDSKAGDETCTRTWYARNTDAGLTSLTSRKRVVGQKCSVPDSALNLPTSTGDRGDILSDEAIAYDGVNWSATMKPTKGLKTWSGRAKSYSATTPSWQTIETTTYDALGRATLVTDAAGKETRTTYTPAAAGPLTKKVVTNPLQHTATTIIDPRRGLNLRTLDANLKKTEFAYDALGRLTDVWQPNRSRAADYSPNQRFDYGLSSTKQSWVSTSTLKSDGETYNTTYTIYDSLLRKLQEQSPSPLGGRVLTDTRYNSRGLAYEEYEEIFDSASTPKSVYTRAEYGEAPKQTETVYDGAERKTSSTLYVYGVKKWSTSTDYTGDSTAESALPGGSGTRTIIDARGRETEQRRYAGHQTTDAQYGSGVGTSHSSTKTQFTLDDKERTVIGPDGATWTYGFDLFGRQTSVSDPDKGKATMSYDVLDQLIKSTDARGETIITSYDKIGRVTGTWEGAQDDAHQLTARTYDSVLKGQPTSNIRYVGGKNGGAYTKSVTAYDSLDRPTATKLTLPTNDPLVAASGADAIELSSSYRLDGTLGTNKEPALGGLPSEVIQYGYTTLGQVKTITGATGYLLDADYSALGRAQQYVLGTANTEEHKKAYVTNTFEEGTGRLTRSHVTDQTRPYMLMDLNYTFDQAGNVVAIADSATLGGTGAAETQCFTYDGYRQLTEAWTPASQNCSDAPSTSKLSGPAPYWTSYTYNKSGQRTAETQHSSAKTTTTYCYTEGRPHILSGTSTSDSCTVPTATYQYDATGNTTRRPGVNDQQSLAWNSEGKLAELTEGSKKTSYLYDADGTLLIRSTADGERILYTGNTELHLRADGTTWAQRAYKSGSLSVAVRTNESGSNKLTYLAGDHQGTQNLAITADSVQSVTKRRSSPFGADRGETSGGAWPSDKGFLGKTKDTATGLTHLDAREYDPKIGQFISVDPLVDAEEPHHLNGYAYSENNPVTYADPTGLRKADCEGGWNECGPGPSIGSGAGKSGGKNKGNSSSGGGGGSGVSYGPPTCGMHCGVPVYGPPSCGVPPLAACGGPVYGPPSQPPLLMGPDPAPILSFSANCGIESDWNFACNAGNGLVTSGSYLQEGFNRSSQLISQSARDMRNHPDPKIRSQAGKNLRSLQTHPGLQRIGSIGRNPTVQAIGGKVLLPAGIGFTAWSNYNSTDGDIALTAAETAVDTAVVIGATKAGATLGATIGTAFGPGGTVVGAAIGGAGGAVAGILMTGPLNNAMSRKWKSVRGWFD